MTELIYTYVTNWQAKTFPNTIPESAAQHLIEEAEELLLEIKYPTSNLKFELADCFILLMGIASLSGMDYDDISNAILEKMSINKKRKWGTPDENGVVKHIS
jgi:NTP pyrophosphatase (non-canonical NTP hydrolase)